MISDRLFRGRDLTSYLSLLRFIIFLVLLLLIVVVFMIADFGDASNRGTPNNCYPGSAYEITDLTYDNTQALVGFKVKDGASHATFKLHQVASTYYHETSSAQAWFANTFVDANSMGQGKATSLLLTGDNYISSLGRSVPRTRIFVNHSGYTWDNYLNCYQTTLIKRWESRNTHFSHAVFEIR